MEIDRPRLRALAGRCPYCHDLLDEYAEQMSCGGCGTGHHLECAQELGRCTVLGCERELEPARAAGRPDSAAVRAVRRRLRRRARAFVRSHARSANPVDLERRLEEALLELHAARAERRWHDAAQAAEAVSALDMQLGRERNQAVYDRVRETLRRRRREDEAPAQPEPTEDQLGPDGSLWATVERREGADPKERSGSAAVDPKRVTVAAALLLAATLLLASLTALGLIL